MKRAFAFLFLSSVSVLSLASMYPIKAWANNNHNIKIGADKPEPLNQPHDSKFKEQASEQPEARGTPSPSISEADLLKLKTAQISAVRELSQLLACPKIDPKNAPKILPLDTQIYYMGRIFEAYRNTTYKIMNNLRPTEIASAQVSLSEESFINSFQGSLSTLYAQPQFSKSSPNTLSKLSISTSKALHAIFADAAIRFQNDARQTSALVASGEIYNEKPGTTLKRKMQNAQDSQHKSFASFVPQFQESAAVLYVNEQRPVGLSSTGKSVCASLDTGESKYTRWEQPKIEERIDSSNLGIKKPLEQSKVVADNSIEPNSAEQQAARSIATPQSSNLDPEVAATPIETIRRAVIPTKPTPNPNAQVKVMATEEFLNHEWNKDQNVLMDVKDYKIGINANDKNVTPEQRHKAIVETYSRVKATIQDQAKQNWESHLAQQALTPQQRYYLAWAENIFHYTEVDGEDQYRVRMANVDPDKDERIKFNAKQLKNFAAADPNVCFTCYSPEYKAGALPLLSQKMLGSDNSYLVKFPDTKSGESMSQNVYDNLAIAFGVLTSKQKIAMPALKPDSP